MITTHWAVLIFNNCGYPKWPIAIMIPQNFFMLALFGDFYRKAYLTKKPIKPDTTNGIYTNGKTITNINNNNNNNIDLNTKNGKIIVDDINHNDIMIDSSISDKNNVLYKRNQYNNGITRDT